MMALLVPMALHRLKYVRIPVVVGEIICGVIAGKSFLKIIDPNDPILNLLQLLGFTYLMFLGGMEMDFNSLLSFRRKLSSKQRGFLGSPIALGTIIFMGTLGLSYAAAYYLDDRGFTGYPTHPLMLALLLGTTSVGVVLPTLKEMRATENPYGQTLLTGSMIADFATIVLATGALLFLTPGRRGLELAALIGLTIAFIMVYRAGARFSSIPRIRKLYSELQHTSAQLRVRTAFALMLLFAVMSDIVGVEIVLGAFLAGAMFRVLFHSDCLSCEMKFDAIGYGFFIPIFFIMVGVKLDLSKIWSSPGVAGLMLILLLLSFAVKLLPSLALWPRFGFRNSLAGGFLLAGRLSLIIAFTEVAVQAGLLQPELEAVSIFIAIVTCTLSPISFMSLFREDKNHGSVGVVILGAGKVGRTLAKRLNDRKHQVSLLDLDPEAVRKTRNMGLNAYQYTELDRRSFEQAGILDSGLFVAVTGLDKVNLDACILVQKEFGISNLVARVGNPDNTPQFTQLGIRPMNTSLASVVALENIMYRPSVYSLLSHEQEGMEVLEVTVSNPEIAGKKLVEIAAKLPGDALVLLVSKEGQTIVPHGDTLVETGDTLTLFLNEGSTLEISRMFDPERPDLQVKCEEIV